jgi:hypothetical protein
MKGCVAQWLENVRPPLKPSKSCQMCVTDLSNVLMVTTTEGMLHRVEGNTTHNRPLVPLGLVLVEGVTGLKHRLVDTSTTSNNADHSTASVGNSLARTGGKLDTGLSGVGVLCHDGAVVS